MNKDNNVDKILEEIEDYQEEIKKSKNLDIEHRNKIKELYFKSLTFEFLKLQNSYNNDKDKEENSKRRSEKLLIDYYLNLYLKHNVLLMIIYVDESAVISHQYSHYILKSGSFIVPENEEYWPEELMKRGRIYR